MIRVRWDSDIPCSRVLLIHYVAFHPHIQMNIIRTKNTDSVPCYTLSLAKQDTSLIKKKNKNLDSF